MAAPLLSKQPIRANTTTVDSLNKPIIKTFYSLKTEGDGNCAFNLLAQDMRELAEFEQLNLIFNNTQFSHFRRHLLASLSELRNKINANPYIAKFVDLLSQAGSHLTLSQLGAFLKRARTKRQIQEMQFALAPALRAYMLEDYPSSNQTIPSFNDGDLSRSGVYAPDDALASLATKSNRPLYIIQQQETQAFDSSNHEPAFIMSKYNNVPDTNPPIYIIHTGGDSLNAHWALGVPVTDIEKVNFWESISEQPARVTKRLNELEEQINELALNVMAALDDPALSTSPIDQKDQEKLIDHLLKKLPNIYQTIESNINNVVTELSTDEYIDDVYQNAIQPYLLFLAPEPNINAIIRDLCGECSINVPKSIIQQAPTHISDKTLMPLGSSKDISPGRSRFTLNAHSCRPVASTEQPEPDLLPATSLKN